MDKLIECSEKSIKNGFKLSDNNYFCETQKIISNLHKSTTATIKNNLVKLDENEKNKENLRLNINNPYKKNSLEEIYNFLLEEEKDIICYYNEASKIFNLNLSDKSKENMLFDDLINNKSTANDLFSLYQTLIKLIGGLFIKKQLTIIMEVCKLLFIISSLRRKYISYEKKNFLNKEQSNLLSQIEKEKCKMEKINLNIRNLYSFVTTKDDIKGVQVSNSLVDKLNGIISILRFIRNITYENKHRTYLTHTKKANTENIFLALYYANQRLSKFTEN
ncbi:fam-j protein [Plasmodium relictum]|uniref:Fam-j protein n=1 Tax=Plasmodium relictum TaxID=85471 RepID=A0A1J1GK92_PLARL|nr:fam-j protein [Plasmodium relictum]CRG84857.1 fam-j protein [Plasmodium relictum]